MQVDPTEHRERPWRVHTLAPDFELLDVWQFDLGTHAELDDVLACFWSVFVTMAEQSLLARARLAVGRLLHWDDHDFTRPLAGCTETTVASRLTDADRAKSRARLDAPSPVPSPEVRPVYWFDDEALYEASNDTIHLMLHLAVVGDAATLAVYIKSRGAFSRMYMTAIEPFRHFFVYPAFTRAFEAAWRANHQV